MSKLYHRGNRELQDQFNSRKLADRLYDLRVREALTKEDCDFIQARDMFFISTVDEQGRPTVSYKGGDRGFVKIIDATTIAFPHYDGNGMFITNGNIMLTNHVGMLFIDFEQPRRLRLHGLASVKTDDSLMADYTGAQQIIRVTISNVFPNCPRYIHSYKKLNPQSTHLKLIRLLLLQNGSSQRTSRMYYLIDN